MKKLKGAFEDVVGREYIMKKIKKDKLIRTPKHEGALSGEGGL